VCSPDETFKNIINKMKNYACLSMLFCLVIVHLKILRHENSAGETSRVLKCTTDGELFMGLIKTVSFFSVNRAMIKECEC